MPTAPEEPPLIPQLDTPAIEQMMHEFRVQIQAAQQQNQSLYELLQAQQAQQVATPPTPSVAPTVVRRRARMPDPEKFTGEDLSLYPQFRQNLRMKLSVDGDFIGGVLEQAYYAYGRLTGQASVRILPYVTTIETSLPGSLDIHSLLDYMDRTFADPETRTRAITKLTTLRQRNREFRDFHAEFEQTMIEANGLFWSDEVKIGYLQNALSARLLQGLIGTLPSTSYNEYVSQLRRIEQQVDLAARARNATRPWPNHATHQGRTTHSNTNAMDWEPTKVNAMSSGRGDSQGKPATWVDVKEIERRRTNNLCLRCGGNGHFVRECRLGPAKRPASSAAPNKPMRIAAVEEVSDGLESDDQQSGKE